MKFTTFNYMWYLNSILQVFEFLSMFTYISNPTLLNRKVNGTLGCLVFGWIPLILREVNLICERLFCITCVLIFLPSSC